MKCPVCENIDLTMADRQGVEIDYCSKCRGVWLDRGELDKIIERTGAVAPSPTSSYDSGHRGGQHASHESRDRDSRAHDLQDHDYRGSGYKGKKKKGLLSDLFDF